MLYLCSALCFSPVEATLKLMFAMSEYIYVFVQFIYFCEKLGYMAVCMVIVDGQSGDGAGHQKNCRFSLPVIVLELVHTHFIIRSRRFCKNLLARHMISFLNSADL
jgi:hypothetical protein